MGKRSKAQPAAAATDSQLPQPVAQANVEDPGADIEPVAKKTRTTRKQQRQQQSDLEGAQKQAKPAAAKTTAGNKKPSKQQLAMQQQQQQAEEGQDVTETKPKKPKRVQKVAAAASTAEAKPAAEKPPYYLVKSEPEEFSIDGFEAKANQTEPWEGVRNAQARNIMRGMAVGDLAFFYHSSCKVPGIVGIAQVVREAYPDPTAFDPKSKYYDANSTQDSPKWWMVDWKLVRKLKRQITLEELKGHKGGALEGMALFNRPRLSVQPVTKEQWEFILGLEETED